MKYLILACCMIPGSALSQSASQIKSSLDSVFAQHFKAGEPGGAVLLVKDGQIFYKNAFGLADMQTKEPITTRTIFNTGSISKTFVAYGILKLAAEGKLSLEDPIGKFFPGFENKEIAGKVKLYHLLTHTSGIPDSRRVKQEHEFYLTARDKENFAPLLKTSGLQFEPGTRYRYSNPAFNGLALIIEQISGIKWQDYIREKIFLPSKMLQSTITDGPHPESGVSHAYILNDKKQFEELDYGEEPTFAAAGNGGVWSSVEELWNYEQAIQNNIFLDRKWMEMSRKIYPLQNWKDDAGSRLGLSWFITTQEGQHFIGHTGSQGGFISDYLWIPEKKIFYVLLCNIPKPILEIRRQVFQALSAVNWLN